MNADLYLRNGLVVTENQSYNGGVLIQDGKIQNLIGGDQDVDAVDIIDVEGKAILPGLVDGHVHYHDPGREHWEGYLPGSQASVAGGVTTVIEMPINGFPTTIDVDKLKLKRDVADGNCVVDYVHWGGLVNNNLADIKPLHEQGVAGFKSFMVTCGTEGFARSDDHILLDGLKLSRELGSVIGVHAENDPLH